MKYIIAGKEFATVKEAVNYQNEIQLQNRDITKITPRMLSKELRELEVNQLVTRNVYDTIPPTVEYELTDYGKSLDKVLDAMREWGLQHRKRIIVKK